MNFRAAAQSIPKFKPLLASASVDCPSSTMYEYHLPSEACAGFSVLVAVPPNVSDGTPIAESNALIAGSSITISIIDAP